MMLGRPSRRCCPARSSNLLTPRLSSRPSFPGAGPRHVSPWATRSSGVLLGASWLGAMRITWATMGIAGWRSWRAALSPGGFWVQGPDTSCLTGEGPWLLILAVSGWWGGPDRLYMSCLFFCHDSLHGSRALTTRPDPVGPGLLSRVRAAHDRPLVVPSVFPGLGWALGLH